MVFDLIVVVAVVGLLVAVVLAASRRDRFNRAVLILLAVLLSLVALDLVAISTDFHDADGIFDCWPACSTWQQVVEWTLSVASLLALALVIAVIFRENWRRRGSSR